MQFFYFTFIILVVAKDSNGWAVFFRHDASPWFGVKKKRGVVFIGGQWVVSMLNMNRSI
jgi:hypothetical protein